jgi:chitinase
MSTTSPPRSAAFLAALILAYGCAFGPATRPQAAPEFRVIGYVASWGVRSKGLRITGIRGEALTHILYAFGAVGPDGLAALGNPCLDIGDCGEAGRPPEIGPGGNFEQLRLLRQMHPHLRVLVSLGGWTGSAHFSDAALTADSRRRLVASTLATFLVPFPDVFDGIDVDWEYPVGGGAPGTIARPEDRENFTLLLEEYRRQLDTLGRQHGRYYELGIAVGAGPRHVANLEVQRLARVVDFIGVMTYDYHAGGTLAHFNAPLFAAAGDPSPRLNVDASMRAFIEAGVPASKLAVGVPFYGRGLGGVPDVDAGLFQRGDPSLAQGWGATGIDYRVLVQRQPERNGFVRHRSLEAQVPWLYNAATGVWISYDDPESVAAKATYARRGGFGGVMIWEIGGDDGSLLSAVRDGARVAGP